MRVGYLTGAKVRLRPLIEEDKDCATAWFDSLFPINASRASVFFDEIKAFWWNEDAITLVIERIDDGEVIGSLCMTNSNRRTTSMTFHMAPVMTDEDALRADALRVVVPWLRDEHEFMVVRLHIAADARETIMAAEELGMQLSARLREFVARPGYRVDRLCYEALNPRWEVRSA